MSTAYWLAGSTSQRTSWETFQGFGVRLDQGAMPGPVVTNVTMDASPIYAPATALTRDVGVSCKVGTEVYWIFGDTILNTAAVDGQTVRQATAAHGAFSNGITGTLTEPLDANGCPFELFSSQTPFQNGTRRPLWPDMLVPHPNGTDMILYYQKQFLPNGIMTGTGAAGHYAEEVFVDELTAAAPTSVDTSNAQSLFTYPEPAFCSGGLLNGGFIYLWPWGDFHPKPFYLARVPHADYRTRASYEFWTGSGWSSSIANCAPVVLQGYNSDDRKQGFSGFHVIYSSYLGKFLMSHSSIFVPRRKLALRVADQPQGPWSAPTWITVTASAFDEPYGNYTARMHPEFATSGGQVLPVTYARSTGALSQILPVAWVTFA